MRACTVEFELGVEVPLTYQIVQGFIWLNYFHIFTVTFLSFIFLKKITSI